jgi:phospholipid/cholesterol/gamma-HCH transport system substrate-binding protein
MSATAIASRLRIRRPRRKLSLFTTGLIVFAIGALAIAFLIFKPQISTWLNSGKTITVEFARNYQLVPNETKVEVAGLPAGVVSDVNCAQGGPCRVSLKVDESALTALGSQPSAEITPNTILGGAYSVSLKHGGADGPFTGDFIPQQRTSTPIELDRVLDALPQPTRNGLQNVLGDLNSTLANGGTTALRQLVADAPATLYPANQLLIGLQGTRPDTDLTTLVTNLEATANALSQHNGQLADIVTSLRQTADVFAAQSQPLTQAVNGLPTALQATRTGLTNLRGTLDQLANTADSFRPAARQLDPLLQHLDPVLQQVQPLLTDLRPLLADLRPTVQQLVPVAQQATHILQDLRGPVLDRINGPITQTLMNTWHGTGPFAGSGGGFQAYDKFYQELGYLAADFDRASMTQDAHGSLLGFQVGAGIGSVGGTPFTLQNLLDQIIKSTGGSP